MYRATLVSESGLYKLVMRSDKPLAKPFQDWVTRDVLPAIRKDGASSVAGKPIDATSSVASPATCNRSSAARNICSQRRTAQ